MSNINVGEKKEQVKATARDNGFTVVVGMPWQLLLDLDAGTTLRDDLLAILAERWPGTVIMDRWKSKDGQGEHVVIGLPLSLTPGERFALQACLGSDPKRELLGVLETVCPSLLFKPGEEK